MPLNIFLKCYGILVVISLCLAVNEVERVTVEHIKNALERGVKRCGQYENDNGYGLSNIVESDGFQDIIASISAIGGLLDMVAKGVPSSLRTDMKQIMHLYKTMNRKVDMVVDTLDKNHNFKELENYEVIYSNETKNILMASDQLGKCLDSLQTIHCSDKKHCNEKRRVIVSQFLKHFDVTQSLRIVLQGTTDKVGKSNEPWLKLLSEAYRGDIPKINIFVNKAVMVAFKAEQVMLAQNLYNYTRRSSILAIEDWLNSLYDLRTKTYRYKAAVYKTIPKCLEDDLQAKFKQGKTKEITEIKSYLDRKYTWLNCVVFSHRQNKHHFMKFGNKLYTRRKHGNTIVVSPQGKGTYSRQRFEFEKVMHEVARRVIFTHDQSSNAYYISTQIKKILKKRRSLKYVRALAVHGGVSGFIFAKGKHQVVNWYNENKAIQVCNGGRQSNCRKKVIHIVAVFKSIEEVKYKTCTKHCNGHGICKLKPLSASTYCECNAHWHGNNCEVSSEFVVVKCVEDMLVKFSNVLGFTNYHFDISKLQTMIAASVGNLHKPMSIIDSLISISPESVSTELKWSAQVPSPNSITSYITALEKIGFFSRKFHNTKRGVLGYHKQQMNLERTVLNVNELPYWLYSLNLFIVGRNEIFLKHKSVLLMVMETYRGIACSREYKSVIYNVWHQLITLQFKGYLIWVEALNNLGKKVTGICKEFKNVLQSQVKHLKKTTCRFEIANSVNGHCNYLFSVFPDMTIDLKCKRNFYLSGTKTPSCNKISQCVDCKCDLKGSISQQCDKNGKCHCKAKHYGQKCSNRDCEWSSWQSWSGCSKYCGYHGIQSRYRPFAATNLGNGKQCLGDKRQKKSCFKGCCRGQFHCSENKKCIPSASRCNYRNDCGNKQDERSCNEQCAYRYTRWDLNGGGNVVYLDRQHPKCHNNEMMAMFHLQRSGHRLIRYQYKCCRLNHVVCDNKLHVNSATSDGGGNSVYLDRQVITCGSQKGFLSDFRMGRKNPHGRGHDHITYYYHCCHVRQPWLSGMHCYTSTTGYTDDGGGKNYYLDRQTVQCSPRYFLNYIHLHRQSGGRRWRFRFTCCKIVQ